MTKSAASIVSAIATLEIPKGEWLEVVNQLSSAVTDESRDIIFRDASIETLQYIMEDALEGELSSEQVNMAMTAFLAGMNNPQL